MSAPEPLVEALASNDNVVWLVVMVEGVTEAVVPLGAAPVAMVPAAVIVPFAPFGKNPPDVAFALLP